MKIAASILAGLISALMCGYCSAGAQESTQGGPAQSFNESGKATVDGKTVSYLVRRLPVNSFPDLPDAVVETLRQRGCLIPQTYQAHRPENVIHASFDRAGSSDWAVLCSAQGKVELLVFFARNPGKAMTVASAPELARIARHDSTGVYGFDWGIDSASPKQVREAQSGLEHHPAAVDHDALADSVLNQKTVYHFYAHEEWTKLDVPE
ncbi:MAG TPA: hypothetical protein VL135_05955 [Terracidiphilus sp.]|nr:hypothetical protein [Terracidiphilus sp.]